LISRFLNYFIIYLSKTTNKFVSIIYITDRPTRSNEVTSLT